MILTSGKVRLMIGNIVSLFYCRLSLNCSPPARCKMATQEFVGPTSPTKNKKKPTKYRSIISDLFDGKILSSVECHACKTVSNKINPNYGGL